MPVVLGVALSYLFGPVLGLAAPDLLNAEVWLVVVGLIISLGRVSILAFVLRPLGAIAVVIAALMLVPVRGAAAGMQYHGFVSQPEGGWGM